MPEVSTELERGRASYARHEWDAACDALTRADRDAPLALDDLERLGWSAAMTGRDDVLLDALERLYHACGERGEHLRAARFAFWLGFRLFGLGEAGRGGGWLARAQRSVEEAGEDGAERGYLLLPVIHRHLMGDEHEAAHDLAAEAADIGQRFGDVDLVTFARNLQGRALVRSGRVAEGLALCDEAMLAAAAGELSPLVTGLVYCTVIATCNQVYALDRSREWTAALAEWCEAQPQLVAFTGSCRVHRAEVMQIGGEWHQAITEARQAAERFADAPDPEAVAEAYYQQGEIHRLRGELDAAEAAYGHASRYGMEPQPGLSLLRLAQGRVDAACSALRRVLGATTEPWQRARFLPACVEILLAAGEIDEAAEAAEELERIASTFDTEVLRAMACHARGAVRLARGDAAGAVPLLRTAFRTWRQVGAPYLAARIRVLLARACHALGDEDGARLERDAARQVFEELGAAPDLAALDPPQQATASHRPHGLTPRELEVLRLVARGLSTKAVARELGVSGKTIDRHLSNIFGKLNVSSRAAATAFAYEHGLV
ncbi:MAG: LuxR C-terminal-related transcriptional regulator [Myxococcota bacterium]